MFSGSIPALVTPFRDGAFDAATFARLVDWQIKEGTSALVPCGTTGESPTTRLRRTLRRYRHLHSGGRGPRSRDRGVRVERYGDRNPPYASCAGGRCHRGADCCPLLQPAEPGRDDRAFPGARRRQRPAHRRATTSRAAPSPTSAPRRCRKLAEIPSVVATKDASGDLARVTMHRAGARKGFLPIERQRRPVAAARRDGRRRLHLGDRKRRAAPLRRFRLPPRLPATGARAGAARPPVRPAQGDVLRHLARAGKICAVARSRLVFARSAPTLSSRRTDASRAAVDAALSAAGVI